MNKAKVILSFLCFFAIWSVNATRGFGYECPKTVGYAAGSLFAGEVVQVYHTIYKNLKCNTQFVPLPPKRILVHFNNGMLEGDIFRLELIEKHLQVPFVKSHVPLFHVSGYLYQNMTVKNAKERPFGYLRGVQWQKEYAQKHPKNSMVINDEESLFLQYRSGVLKRFLSGAFRVNHRIQEGFFDVPPVAVEKIFTQPLWHYLHADYADFMKAFSDYVTKHKSFAEIEKMAIK